MPINEFRAIAMSAKAIEFGSIRRAAQAQGVTPQAASQAIAQLEQHLGVRLLHRTTRNLALTEEGQRLLENTQPAIAALDRALAMAREAKDDIAGPLRIVGPKSSFASILMPLLDEFCRTYPDIQPDVQLDDGIGNWVLDRVDVGFRIGASPSEGVIGRQLFPIQMIVCAAPAYLATYGVPATLDDLVTHRCSVFRHPATGTVAPWYLTVDGKLEHRPMSPAFSTNDSDSNCRLYCLGKRLASLRISPRRNTSVPAGWYRFYSRISARTSDCIFTTEAAPHSPGACDCFWISRFPACWTLLNSCCRQKNLGLPCRAGGRYNGRGNESASWLGAMPYEATASVLEGALPFVGGQHPSRRHSAPGRDAFIPSPSAQ